MNFNELVVGTQRNACFKRDTILAVWQGDKLSFFPRQEGPWAYVGAKRIKGQRNIAHSKLHHKSMFPRVFENATREKLHGTIKRVRSIWIKIINVLVILL